MAAQDDAREREMRTLFNLTRPVDAGRSDVDAVLHLKGRSVPAALRGRVVQFELKSATSGRASISTGRDFGLHTIERWRDRHWLFGIYSRDAKGDQALEYCMYGSPRTMKPWFDEQEDYVKYDVELAEHVPELLTLSVLRSVMGKQSAFSREEAKLLMKKQYSAEDYRATADLPGQMYSQAAMLEMLRERCQYLIERGSTRNNPHIPASYFKDWERITEDHAARLRELVAGELTRRRRRS